MKLNPGRFLFVTFCVFLAYAWLRLTRPLPESSRWPVDLARLMMDSEAVDGRWIAVKGRVS